MVVEPGLDIEVVYFDDDLVELRVTASNGVFRAQADIYENHEAPHLLADALRGFPTSPTDRVERTLGHFDPSYGGGGALLSLSCRDSLGHCCLRVIFRTDPHRDRDGSATAEFSVEIEPAGIDEFVSSLDAMRIALGANAHLPARTAA